MSFAADPAHMASKPQASAVVTASAGTGKTYLLVTRILRLLLHGIRGESILAITFTRKAAEEMHARLNKRMLDLAAATPGEVQTLLTGMGVSPTVTHLHRAVLLYEQALRAERHVRTTTFHAFCQDLLQRFPVEAGVEPGFELVEDSEELAEEAWQVLCDEATHDPQGKLAGALDTLFKRCGGLTGARTALSVFLNHRNDWWAYTLRDPAPVVTAAIERIRQQLSIERSTVDPAGAFFNREALADLQSYHDLLLRHTTRTNQDHARLLHACMYSSQPARERLQQLGRVLLTRNGSLRKRSASASQVKAMGSSGQKRFLELHQQLSERLLHTKEQLRTINTFETSSAWYIAGDRLVEHYQAIKHGRRLLDFNDLEWRAYLLLNQAENALWVQYKLDQQIEHLLVDEFQDTNPTQWHLLLPLLQEMAASPDDQQRRSVFIVGDSKQSIYRFRRADARLMTTAGHWLQQAMEANTVSLTHSYRSAPLIIEFVNSLFSSTPLQQLVPEFDRHQSKHSERWGKIELMPLVSDTASAPPDKGPADLRNPLSKPRPVAASDRHFNEGCLIGGQIKTLLHERTPVDNNGIVRPIRYDDIIVVVRSRTHLAAYQDAFRLNNIPYIGCDRASMLDDQEIRDLVALLTTLVAPYDNLALATVLRSPIFACRDSDLMLLAQAVKAGSDQTTQINWKDALHNYPDNPLLAKASCCLERWRDLAGRIPVHDIIDRILAETNLAQRYMSVFPEHLHGRIRLNLKRFVELALEVDSGRYPSLPHFLARLRNHHGAELNDQGHADSQQAQGNVRIMTIHGVKGLEASAVFVADSTATIPATRPYNALIDWPPEQEQPTCFLLTGKRSELDTYSRRQLEQHEQLQRREDANLLYVALTRARQYLFISGCTRAGAGELGWYGIIREYARQHGHLNSDGSMCLSSGPAPPLSSMLQKQNAAICIDQRLSSPLTRTGQDSDLASPGHSAGEVPDADNADRERGTVIHRMLELLNKGVVRISSGCPLLFDDMAAFHASAVDLDECWDEACRVVSDVQLRELFDPSFYLRAYNEVPLQYRANGCLVHGRIDRLVVYERHVLLIDYKTHRLTDGSDFSRLASAYREQMRLYRNGIAKLWPRREVKCALLFTARPLLYIINTH